MVSRIRRAVEGRNRPVGFTARNQAGIDQFSVAFLRRRIRKLHSFNLRRGEAIVAIAISAQQRRWVEMTLHRIRQEPVFHSVELVARREDTPIHHQHLRAGDDSPRIFPNRRIQIGSPRSQLKLIVRRRACDDSIEVLGIARRLH